jgi:hypothetical protein
MKLFSAAFTVLGVTVGLDFLVADLNSEISNRDSDPAFVSTRPPKH